MSALDPDEASDDLDAGAAGPGDDDLDAADEVAVEPTPQAHPGRRGVQRLQPNAQRSAARRQLKAGSQAAIFEPLPPENAAIPLDRVPYFIADFHRVLMTAGLMVGIIVVAAIVVSVAVK